MQTHGARKHSKFSASGAERWIACPGSVQLSEGLPDRASVYSIEGTTAHEVLEHVTGLLWAGGLSVTEVLRNWKWQGKPDPVMVNHAINAASFMHRLARDKDAELLVETRINASIIHPEAFGTFDGAVLDHFGVLDVIDFKYGAGHAVSPYKNLQMIFYAAALAHAHHWNFKSARLWIIQPRIKGYDGPTFWQCSMQELKDYAAKLRDAARKAETHPNEYNDGPHCHWCKAKNICPIKRASKVNQAKSVFGAIEGAGNGEKESFKEKEIEARINKAFENFGKKETKGAQARSTQAETYDFK